MSASTRKEIPIKGMHCSACEILVKDELLSIKGVKSAEVNRITGKALIQTEGSVSDTDIDRAVRNAGYTVGTGSLPFIRFTQSDAKELVVAVVLVALGYILLRNISFGETSLFNGSSFSLPVVFAIGLTAGFSTCMALVGGLVLGLSGKFAKDNPNAKLKDKMQPQIYFNLGRLISFGVFGALLGGLGSAISINPTVTAVLTIIVALMMVLLGLQTLGIFPALNRISFSLPPKLYEVLRIKRKSSDNYSNSVATYIGAATFFVPCGFTQSMQLYAVTTGDALTGAMVMFIFALGTTPGLFAIGSISGLVTGKHKGYFFKTVSVAVLLLAVFNISSAMNVFAFEKTPNTRGTSRSQLDTLQPTPVNPDDYQVIIMTQKYDGYYPSSFTVKKDLPVKWVVNSVDSYSCASSVYSAPLGINTRLKPGENLIEFTPKKVGKIKFSCSMGMFVGTINVVE